MPLLWACGRTMATGGMRRKSLWLVQRLCFFQGMLRVSWMGNWKLLAISQLQLQRGKRENKQDFNKNIQHLLREVGHETVYLSQVVASC